MSVLFVVSLRQRYSSTIHAEAGIFVVLTEDADICYALSCLSSYDMLEEIMAESNTGWSAKFALLRSTHSSSVSGGLPVILSTTSFVPEKMPS